MCASGPVSSRLAWSGLVWSSGLVFSCHVGLLGGRWGRREGRSALPCLSSSKVHRGRGEARVPSVDGRNMVAVGRLQVHPASGMDIPPGWKWRYDFHEGSQQRCVAEKARHESSSCERVGGVQGVLTLSCGGAAQTCHDESGCRAQGTTRVGGSRRRRTGRKSKGRRERSNQGECAMWMTMDGV